MKADFLLAALIGFIQGYFGLVFVVGLGKHLFYESIKFWKNDSVPLTKLITSILAYIFLIIFFFGVAAIWIELLSQGSELIEIDLAKAWGKGWFIGLIIFCLLPTIERKFTKKKKNN